MANYKEEQIRNSRRLARQALGAAALLLALIGLLTVAGWLWSALCSVLDDSGRRQEYADRLYGMVMLDPLPFDDVQAVDPGVFKQAAIWGTVYEAQKDGGTLDQYERDPDTGSAMIPKLEIDTYIANLLGPDYEITDGSFTTDQFVYQYTSNRDIMPLPDFTLYSNLYYFKQFRRAGFQAGIDIRYYTAFYANIFDPYTGLFHTQHTQKIGNYPELGLYANVRVLDGLKIYAEWNCWNSGLFGGDCSPMPGIARTHSRLDVGIAWDLNI